MSEHFDQIASAFDRLSRAWNRNDAAAVAGLFAGDGSLINPFGERADGRSAIADMYTRYFDGMLAGTSTDVVVSSVRAIEGGHAFADCEQTIKAPDGQVVLAVHVATLLRREGDGWCLVDSRPYAFATPPS